MADYAIIVAGFDPTSLGGTAPNNSQLLQMVQEAQFADDVGGIIYAQAAPDVVAYPILKRFRWGELNGSNQRTGKFYYYKDSVSAWTLETPADGTINGSAFIDGTIAVTKLAPGTAAYLLRTNGAGTAAEWAPVATAIPDGSLSLAKLTSGVALPDYIIRTDGAGQFIAQLFTTYLESLFALDKYVPFSTLYEDGAGTENQALFINNASPRKGLTAAWVEDKLRANQTATSKLNHGGTGNALKYPRVNSTGLDYDYVSPDTLVGRATKLAHSIPTPGSANVVPWAHGLGAKPRFVEVRLECTDAGGDAGWADGDEVNIFCFNFAVDDVSTDYVNAPTIYSDATYVYINWSNYTSARVMNKSTGTSTVADMSKWTLNIYASL